MRDALTGFMFCGESAYVQSMPMELCRSATFTFFLEFLLARSVQPASAGYKEKCHMPARLRMTSVTAGTSVPRPHSSVLTIVGDISLFRRFRYHGELRPAPKPPWQTS